MGLLDDAIREHLESKRLRGADPEEVAREEQEALGPVHRGQSSTLEQPEPYAKSPGPDEDDPRATSALASEQYAHTGQETAELDMRTVLEADQAGAEGRTGPGSGASTGDSLEWETPGEASADQPGHVRDQGADPQGSSEGTVEDVLEETPDFLRETPDQERLWFEQQPPRDFDFDK